MTIQNCNADTSVVRDLPDEPAITASELKAAFDGAADNIKTWLNSIHLPALNNELAAKQDRLNLNASSAVFTDGDGAAISKTYAQARELLGLGDGISTGILDIAYGGTGANSANGAMSALCEYGTFSPVLKGSITTGNVDYQTREGEYYRMGDFVFISLHIVTSSLGGASGNVNITGLPFSVVNENHTSVMVSSTFSGNSQGYTSLNNGALFNNTVVLYCTTNNGAYNGYLTFGGMSAVSDIHVSGMYRVA